MPEVIATRINKGSKKFVKVTVDGEEIKGVGGNRAERCSYAIVTECHYPNGTVETKVHGLRSNHADALNEAQRLHGYNQFYVWAEVVEIKTVRRALITTGIPTDSKKIAQYLPSNYTVTGEKKDGKYLKITIEGVDVAGWTLDGYVIPRLASGLYFAEEID